MTTTVTLGSTGITVNKNGFGALPVQRVSKEDGAALLKKAYENGITFLTLPGLILTARKRSAWPLAMSATISTLPPKPWQTRRKASGKT